MHQWEKSNSVYQMAKYTDQYNNAELKMIFL
jgi:hypothetical protein